MSNRPRVLLTREQLRDRLLGLVGATAVTFIGVTDPDWIKFKRGETDPKTGGKIPNPYIGKVVKVARINAQVNWTYDNAVINRSMKAVAAERAEAGEAALSETDLRHEAVRRFEQGESWMVPYKVNGKLTPFCVNKKDAERAAAEGIEGVATYLWVRCLACLGVTFINTETGDEVSREELAPFMGKESENAGANQGIENADERIIPRAFGFAGIAELNTSGECWVNESWYNANASVRQAIETLAGTLQVPA